MNRQLLKKLKAELESYWGRGDEAPDALLEKVLRLSRPDRQRLRRMLARYEGVFLREMTRTLARHAGGVVAELRRRGRKGVAVTDALWRKYQHRTHLTEDEARECLYRPGDVVQPAGIGHGDDGGILLQIYELDLRLDAAAPPPKEATP
jgi:hypothetical protein